MQPNATAHLEAGPTKHPLHVLGLPTRTRKALYRAGIRTVEQLARLSDAQILAVHGLGESGVATIRAALQQWEQHPPSSDLAQTPTPEQSLADVWSLPQSVCSDPTDISALGLRPLEAAPLTRLHISTVGELASTPLSVLTKVCRRTRGTIRRQLSAYAVLESGAAAPRGERCTGDRGRQPMVDQH